MAEGAGIEGAVELVEVGDGGVFEIDFGLLDALRKFGGVFVHIVEVVLGCAIR